MRYIKYSKLVNSLKYTSNNLTVVLLFINKTIKQKNLLKTFRKKFSV